MKKISVLVLFAVLLLCACNSQTEPRVSDVSGICSESNVQEASEPSAVESFEESDQNESTAAESAESSEGTSSEESEEESEPSEEREESAESETADHSEAESTEESMEESTEESTEESKEEPKNVLAPGNPIQKNHQTPEALKESSEFSDKTAWETKSPITPIYVVIRDADMSLYGDSEYNIVKKSGLKVWICTKDGKKVDYVYTNSKGVAAFEAMEGEYTFYFEGTDKYAPKYYHKTVKVREVYTGGDWSYQYSSGYQRIRYPIFSYVEEKHKELKIYVTDAETGKPVKNAYVTVQSDGGLYEAYTDENGVATTKSLLANYDGNVPHGKDVTVTAEGYRPAKKDINVIDNEVHIQITETIYHNVKITCVDAITGKPIQGVVATQKQIEKWDKDSHLIIAESGADGVISLVVTDYTVSLVGARGLELSYTDSEGQSFSCDYNLNGAYGRDDENVEYTLKVEKTDTGYVIRSMYD